MSSSVQREQIGKFEGGRSNVRILRKGDALFRQADAFEAIYIVRSGSFKTLHTNEEGDQQIAGFYLPGEVLGLDAIDDEHHASDAVALETSSVCVFPFRGLVNLASSIPELQRRLWQQMSHEIIACQRMQRTVGHGSAEVRAAEFLLSVSGRYKRIGCSGARLYLTMSRQDIADYLGLSVETVCRVFTRFQKIGILKRSQREITIRNFEALLKLSLGDVSAPSGATARAVAVG